MPVDAQALAWIDIETSGLPEEGDGVIDFRGVHVLEFAMIVTDLDLNPIKGQKEVVRLTQEAAEAIRANDFVREMHMANNLIRDCAQSPDAVTLEELETILIETLTAASFDRGTYMIAGSGVARFDFPLIKAKMPKLAKWFVYAELDIGQSRRAATILNGGNEVVNPLPQSSRDTAKTHRAWDDVKAHLDEAKRYQTFYQSAYAAQI